MLSNRRHERIVEDQGRRKAQAGCGNQAVSQLHRRERVEAEILERPVRLHILGGWVTEHGSGMAADEVDHDGIPLVFGNTGQAIRQRDGAMRARVGTRTRPRRIGGKNPVEA